MASLRDTLLVLGAVLGALVCTDRADAQLLAGGNPQLSIEYREPEPGKATTVAYGELRAFLQERKVLELLSQFLVPLRLREKLAIEVAECGATTRPYRRGGSATICYEQIAEIYVTVEGIFEKVLNKELERVTSRISDAESRKKTRAELLRNARETAFVGTTVQALLHNVAKAVFEILSVPVWGRMEDAADRLTAFVMLQFGDEVARKTINGTALFFRLSPQVTGKQWTGSSFAAVGSPEAQRYFNYLCIALGGDPLAFADSWGEAIAAETSANGRALLEGRAKRCRGEYQQVSKAFNLRIMPHVDEQLALEVRARQGAVLGRLR